MMRLSHRHLTRRSNARPADRRGMAIIITLILTAALGALALSSVYLSGNTKIGSGLSDRSATLQYAADAGLQMGKSYINADHDAMPASGYREITFNNGDLMDAEEKVIPNVKVRVWAGPTGATTGQFGAFGSIIAEATDNTGGRVVRRLELAQENFARFAYWSNKENRGTGPLWFNGGDVIFGPMWSNDSIRIASKAALPFAAQFRDVVGTAAVVIQSNQADWWKGYTENAIPISMPAPAQLSNLAAYATSGRLNFTAPSSGDESSVRMRIEFVNVDIDNDGSDKDPQDGFIRVYRLNGGGKEQWLRADWQESGLTDRFYRTQLCGEWLTFAGTSRFYSGKAHSDPAVVAYVASQMPGVSNGIRVGEAAALGFSTSANPISSLTMEAMMSRTGAAPYFPRSQCFLGGSPELNYNPTTGVGGSPFVFNNSDSQGEWLPYGGTIDPRVTARRGTEANYLFPLHRSVNSGARGVIHVSGTVGVSGTVVGRVTLRTTGTAVILDDIKYGTNPATTGQCIDVLGILSEKDIVVADNMMNSQVLINTTSSTTRRIMDDTKDLNIHAVVMALDRSFRVEKYDQGFTTGNPCNGTERGHGCLALLGGIIQEARGAVTTFSATSGTGYLKQYTYDRCANLRPPPYFPTTGRFLDNRYMEIDPVNFNISNLMARLTPVP
jgi:hypothetical protein